MPTQLPKKRYHKTQAQIAEALGITRQAFKANWLDKGCPCKTSDGRWDVYAAVWWRWQQAGDKADFEERKRELQLKMQEFDVAKREIEVMQLKNRIGYLEDFERAKDRICDLIVERCRHLRDQIPADVVDRDLDEITRRVDRRFDALITELLSMKPKKRKKGK